MNAISQNIAEETAPAARRNPRRRTLLLAAAPVVALIAGGTIYFFSGQSESTDNAYVQRALVPIAPKVGGQVVSIDVKENQPVKAGQILFRIDPAPFELAVNEAMQAPPGNGGSPVRGDLDRARLLLSYTIVRAPQDGIVTKVNQLQVGSSVSASRPVFTLVGSRAWIEANFKESQLPHMRIGQRADFRIDAFPGLKLHGRLESFSPGTGSSFSVLPPENATGNWVKVVQRLSVQFAIDDRPDGVPLPAGLSVAVTVITNGAPSASISK